MEDAGTSQVTETQGANTEGTEGFAPTPLTEIFGGIKPSSQVDTEGQAKEPEKPEEKKEEEKQAEAEKKDEPPPVDWQKRAQELEKESKSFKKRYEDTQKWGNKAHQKLQEFGLDENGETIPDVPDELKAANEAFTHRERASYAAAIEIHGREKVDELLFGENSPLKEIIKDPSVAYAIQNADAPVLEAIKAINTEAFLAKYGRDPETVHAAIEKELEAKIREKLTKEFQQKLEKKDKIPNTLSGIKSGDLPNGGVFTPTPLKDIFG